MAVMSLSSAVFKLRIAPEQDSLLAFADRSVIKTLALTNENELLLVCAAGKKLNLKNGHQGLARQLRLPAGAVLERVPYPPKTLPNRWILENIQADGPEGEAPDEEGLMSKFTFTYGESLSVHQVLFMKRLAVAGKNKTKVINSYIMDHGVVKSIEDGVVSLKDGGKAQDGYDIVKRRGAADDVDMRQDLVGVHSYTFEHYSEDPATSLLRPSNKFPPTTVDISVPSQENMDKIKKRNWWIYSSAASMGKSFFLDHMTTEYNCTLVGDSKNLIGVAEDSQFMLFDECRNLLDVDGMKALTSGKGGVSLNRKTYGKSFEPRKDVQVIVCCNKSIWEHYGTYNQKTKRRVMAPDLVDQLETRFHVIKLDGPANEDRLEYVDPTMWSDREAKLMLKKILYDRSRVLNEVGLLTENILRSVLHGMYVVHEDRWERAGVTTCVEHFCIVLAAFLVPHDKRAIERLLSGLDSPSILRTPLAAHAKKITLMGEQTPFIIAAQGARADAAAVIEGNI